MIGDEKTEGANSPENAADSAFGQANDSFTSTETDEAQQRIATLEYQLADANSRILKAQAELENFRKRVRREQEEELRYAALPLARDLLSVVDNLERAMQSAEATGGQGLLEGVKMVALQFGGILEQHGCKRIAALGAEFDPNLHQAIAQEHSDEIASGSVSKVAQSGYTLHDRVLRPAQVFVSLGKNS